MIKKYYLYPLLCLVFAACDTKSTGEQQEEAMAESLAWQRAVTKNTEYHYLKYGELFPKGKHIVEVEEAFEQIESSTFTKEELMAKRFTGFIEQFDDKQVFSLRFTSMEEEDDEEEGILNFECIANMGALGKKLNGIVELESNIIQFIEAEGGAQMKVQDGRIYLRNDKILLESTELEQYWILD